MRDSNMAHKRAPSVRVARNAFVARLVLSECSNCVDFPVRHMYFRDQALLEEEVDTAMASMQAQHSGPSAGRLTLTAVCSYFLCTRDDGDVGTQYVSKKDVKAHSFQLRKFTSVDSSLRHE